MIGDSRTDLDTARSAGVPFVGVSFGYTPVPMAELGPDILIDEFDELEPRATPPACIADAAEAAGRGRPWPRSPCLDFADRRYLLDRGLDGPGG